MWDPSPRGAIQSCPTFPSSGTHDSWRQLPDLFILHCHLLLQHGRWCPKGLPGDIRDALGSRRGELEGPSFPRADRTEWHAQKPGLPFSGLGCGWFVCPGLVLQGLWKGWLSVLCSASSQIRETRRTVRDSDSGLEQMSIGHHIRDRAHILQRSRNHRTGDQEERQDYINLDESEPAFPLHHPF